MAQSQVRIIEIVFLVSFISLTIASMVSVENGLYPIGAVATGIGLLFIAK